MSLLSRLTAWLEGWSVSLAGAGLSPEQLLTFSNAKSEFWLYLVEMLAKLAEHPDAEVGQTLNCGFGRVTPVQAVGATTVQALKRVAQAQSHAAEPKRSCNKRTGSCDKRAGPGIVGGIAGRGGGGCSLGYDWQQPWQTTHQVLQQGHESFWPLVLHRQGGPSHVRYKYLPADVCCSWLVDMP